MGSSRSDADADPDPTPARRAGDLAPLDDPASREPADTVAKVVSPEGVALEYRIAGPGSRVAAYALDGLIKFVVAMVAFLFLQRLALLGQGILLLLLFLLEYFYYVAFEIALNGQSPGKRVFSLRVISQNGTPMAWQQSLIRNLLRPADRFPLFYGVGGALMASSERFQRLGDLAAGTIVVLDDRTPTPVRSQHSRDETAALLRWIPNHFKQNQDLRVAVGLYARKRSRLGPSLRREIAQPVVDLVASQTDLPPDTDPDLLMAALHRSMWEPSS